jgi:hypothetical protein
MLLNGISIVDATAGPGGAFFQGVFQPGCRIDSVEFGRAQQGLNLKKSVGREETRSC